MRIRVLPLKAPAMWGRPVQWIGGRRVVDARSPSLLGTVDEAGAAIRQGRVYYKKKAIAACFGICREARREPTDATFATQAAPPSPPAALFAAALAH